MLTPCSLPKPDPRDGVAVEMYDLSRRQDWSVGGFDAFIAPCPACGSDCEWTYGGVIRCECTPEPDPDDGGEDDDDVMVAL